MNIGKIYHEHTKGLSPEEQALAEINKKLNESASIEDAKLSQQREHENRLAHGAWLAQSFTKQFFRELQDMRDSLITSAVNNSLAYPQHNNHQIIISQLTQAANIEKLLTTYARTTSNDGSK